MALPCSLSAIWLVGVWRRRKARPPVDRLVRAVDVGAGLSLAIFLGTGLWIWFGGPLRPVALFGGMPLQLFIAYVVVAPALSGLVWVILRATGGEGQRLGLRKADHAAEKRSAQV